MPAFIAPKTTRVTLAVDRIISANTISVLGIVIANNLVSAVSVDFVDNDGTIILTLNCPAEDSREFESNFIADNGFIVDATGIDDANVLVTVLHSHDGA